MGASMASIENKPMDGQLVESKEFPNIKVDKGMLDDFDQVMKDLKKGAEADEGVKLFVQKLNELKDYKIYDGSKSDYCIGGHSGGSLKEINIPIEFVKEQGGKGQYYGKLDKNNNAVGLIDATLPRAIVHELAHATKLDREGSPLTRGIVDKLDSLEKQIQLDNKMAGAKYGVYNAKVRQEQGCYLSPLIL